MTVLLHGFWGQPSDWNAVLQKLPLGEPVSVPDLYAPGELSPNYPLSDWVENFWRWADESFPGRKIQLIGYSMGARLAVTAALAKPEKVERALFISGNPLFAQKDFADREKWEAEWATNFLEMEWSELEAAWQEQPVFANTPSLARRKTPEMREILGLSLKQWSPRLHPFHALDVQAMPASMEWAFGASDQNYMVVANTLQELRVKGQIAIVTESGHRLITEAPDFVCQWIQKGNKK